MPAYSAYIYKRERWMDSTGSKAGYKHSFLTVLGSACCMLAGDGPLCSYMLLAIERGGEEVILIQYASLPCPDGLFLLMASNCTTVGAIKIHGNDSLICL